MSEDTPAARAEAEASRAKAKNSALIDKSQNPFVIQNKSRSAQKKSAGPESVTAPIQQYET
jgi:hypothetical protein